MRGTYVPTIGIWQIFGQNISTHDFPVGLYGAVGANLEGTSVVWERPLMTSDDFRRFLTYLPTPFNPKTSDFLGHFEPPYLP